MACVRSGILGWVIGLFIHGRAGAERRAANPGRRCWPTARPAAVFYFGLGDRRWRSSDAADFYLVGEFFGGAVRRPPLAAAGRRAAFGCGWRSGFWHRPTATASLNLLGKGVAVNHCFLRFSRAREGGPSASGFDPVAPARSYGDSSARADRNRWPRGWPWRVCALAFQAG